ncbi:MAG: hypothetical protein J5706_04540 [Elusimicrobiales bacterium]|nr:hypothetical protein [Elusimicrobiales bacterium]
MNEKEFLDNVDKIIEMLLKNAGHSFGIDFKIVNDTDIELQKRRKALKQKEDKE